MTRDKLIISADDFGISQKANENILELVRLKKIDRVAILVNGMISQNEISELIDSHIKLDIHFNLNKLNSTDNRSPEGVWIRLLSFFRLYFTGAIGVAPTEISWEEQISKFEKMFGRKPDGANSHQHIHFFPAYLKIFLKLCKKHQLSYLRFGRCCLKKNRNSICFILNILRLKNLKLFSQYEIETSEMLISLDWIKNIKKFFQNPPLETTEIVCHPEKDLESSIIKNFF